MNIVENNTEKVIDLLNEQIDKTRGDLKNVDFDIRKIGGPGAFHRQFGGRNRGRFQRDGDTRYKPQNDNSYKRRFEPSLQDYPESENDDYWFSDHEESNKRPAIQSSVVEVVREPLSHKEITNPGQHRSSGPEKQRNKRVFGALLNKLRDFKKDHVNLMKTPEAIRRQELEVHVEMRQNEEKVESQNRIHALISQRSEKQQRLNLMQRKLSTITEHKEWEKATVNLRFHIRTEAQPHVFYRPKVMNDESTRRLETTTSVVDGIITERRSHVIDNTEFVLGSTVKGEQKLYVVSAPLQPSVEEGSHREEPAHADEAPVAVECD